MVFGALSLIITSEKLQKNFLIGMVALGLVGTYFGVHAFLLSSTI